MTDDCGNVKAVYTQIITIVDNTAPSFTAPADVTFYTSASCVYNSSPAVTGDVVDENDNCSTTLEAMYSDSIFAGSCIGEYVISRTWSLFDNCCNAAASQILYITVKGTIKPAASNPADSIYECFSEVPAPDPSVVTDEADNCDLVPVVAFVSKTSSGVGCNVNPRIINRVYCVTDQC